MYTTSTIDLICHNGFLQEISHRMQSLGLNMRWEVPVYENISTIVCLSRIYKCCIIDVSVTSYCRTTYCLPPTTTIVLSSYQQPLSCNVKRSKPTAKFTGKKETNSNRIQLCPLLRPRYSLLHHDIAVIQLMLALNTKQSLYAATVY
jgi:hypothetical protein